MAPLPPFSRWLPKFIEAQGDQPYEAVVLENTLSVRNYEGGGGDGGDGGRAITR